MSRLRKLAKSYANKKISRDEYLVQRTHLLNQLEIDEFIDTTDVDELTSEKNEETFDENNSTPAANEFNEIYTYSDIAIYILGFIAAVSLAYILYS